jgi:hypothetical protein
MTETFVAPWSLRGQGHIFLYRFSQAFLAQRELMPASLRDSFVGGVGALMLVNYTHSDCGPYRELLLIPGNFCIAGVVRPSITQIVVSSEASVVNGRRNWGIPKYHADFVVAQQSADSGAPSESWKVRGKTGDVFSATVSPVRFAPRLPIHSAVIPHTLAQWWESRLFVTKVSASGWGKPSRLTAHKEGSASYLDLSNEHPLLGLGVSVDPFRMTFHVPTISTAEST